MASCGASFDNTPPHSWATDGGGRKIAGGLGLGQLAGKFPAARELEGLITARWEFKGAPRRAGSLSLQQQQHHARDYDQDGGETPFRVWRSKDVYRTRDRTWLD